MEDHYLTDEREGLRFLAANRWNIENTWEDIKKNTKWRKETLPAPITEKRL
jgi:hypothetical protein